MLAMMQERGILARGDTIAYALGIRVETYRGQRRFAHLGADAGYRTSLSYFPTIDAGVIVLSNSAEFSVGTVGEQVADDFFETAMAPRSPGPVVVAPAVLRSLVGNFALAPDSDVVFTTESDSTLFMEVLGQPRFPLTPLADTVFRIDAPGIEAQIRFESNPDGVSPVARSSRTVYTLSDGSTRGPLTPRSCRRTLAATTARSSRRCTHSW